MNAGENAERWDVISLSLVINFISDPYMRGRMLQICYDFLRPSGLLFLALPSPCVQNSRYLTTERLVTILSAIGFSLHNERLKDGGKMAYWQFAKTGTSGTANGHLQLDKKTIIRDGKHCNNFCILLPKSVT